MGLSIALFVAALLPDAPAAAQTETGFVDRVSTDDGGEHKYVVFVPRDYTAEKKWPVILFLHGAGERGTDGRAQTNVGLGAIVRKRTDRFPFLVVFPQCEDVEGRRLTGWAADGSDAKRALRILDEVEKQYSVDPARRILTGWSMGGYGAWSVGARAPDRWSAVVPVAGGGDPGSVAGLSRVPVWAFAGANDRVTPPEETRRMVEALQSAGGRVRLTEVPNVGHEVWQTVYENDALYEWMLNPLAAPQEPSPFGGRPGTASGTQPPPETEFVPALEIPRAVYLRLGNDMLNALSYSIPQKLPETAKHGRLADIQSTTNAAGRSFSVQFTGVSYQAEIVRAHVEAYKKDHLNLQLALSNVQLSVARTLVSGESHSAVTGPLAIVIGKRRPVWLSVDVTPYIEDGRIRLRWIGSRFDIEEDNWYVDGPYGVQTWGFGMSRDRVVEGVRSGIKSNKSRIQREALALVPPLLSDLEKRLDVAGISDLVNVFWPLPVYRPRVRLWPSEVATDERGVSLLLGVKAAAIDPRKTPPVPKQLQSAGPSLAELAASKSLEVGIAPSVLNAMTSLLIDSDVARIHVRDIPQEKFAVFTDPAVMSEAVPELRRFGDKVELWAELVLAEPLTLEGAAPEPGTRLAVPQDSPADAGGGVKQTSAEHDGFERDAKPRDAHADDTASAMADESGSVPGAKLTLEVPRLMISLAARARAADDWTPLAEFSFKIAQATHAAITEPSFARRGLRIVWDDHPGIEATGHFAPGYTPENAELNVERVRELFTTAWRAWVASGTVSEVAVADIDFGFSRLRLDGIAWSDPHLMLSYAEPGFKITNRTKAPLMYETRGPFSRWGGPYTLPPGQTHEFRVASPIQYRQHTGRSQMFTIPVGSQCEFRTSPSGGEPSLVRIRQRAAQARGGNGGSRDGDARASAN